MTSMPKPAEEAFMIARIYWISSSAEVLKIFSIGAIKKSKMNFVSVDKEVEQEVEVFSCRTSHHFLRVISFFSIEHCIIYNCVFVSFGVYIEIWQCREVRYLSRGLQPTTNDCWFMFEEIQSNKA